MMIEGRADIEVEAESISEAKEKFHKFAQEKKSITCQPPPSGQNVYIEITPVTDVSADTKLILPGKEENNA